MCASACARIVFLSLGVAAIPVEKIVRRESVQLGSSGEFVKYDEKAEGQNINFCNYDFPLGTEAMDGCPTGSVPLTSKAECEQAAKQAGLQHTTVATVVDSFKWARPKGCFMEPCPEATAAGQNRGGAGDGPCYRWNDRDPGPDNITQGQPVCHRARVKLGVVDATKDYKIDCGPGYAPVTEEALCLQDGPCIGSADAHHDIVNQWNANEYNKYPLFCFREVGISDGKRADSDSESRYPKVEFNEPLPNQSWCLQNPPSNPVGLPICNVTNITWFDKDGFLTSDMKGCVRKADGDCEDLPLAPAGSARTTH